MLELLLTYKYIILIPLSIIEGPIVTILCGFLVTLGVLNPVWVYIIMVLGDVIGDAGIYYIGYSGKKLLKYFKISEEKLEKAKDYFKENHKKALVTSKLVHGLGFTGLIAAAASHVPYKKYFKTCATVSVIQSFVMLIIGILFGHAYVQIGQYLNFYAAGASVLVLLIILFIFIRKYKLGKKTSL
ncbi:MAG: DedA family protein [Minisyncoccia bacterium]